MLGQMAVVSDADLALLMSSYSRVRYCHLLATILALSIIIYKQKKALSTSRMQYPCKTALFSLISMNIFQG